MVLSTVEANKIAKAALNLLKISVGFRLSKSVIDTMSQILSKNGVEMKKGGAKRKMKGGANSAEAKMIEQAALKLLKVAVGYDLSAAVLSEMQKLLSKNGLKKE